MFPLCLILLRLPITAKGVQRGGSTLTPLMPALKPSPLRAKTQTYLVKHAQKSSISMTAIIKDRKSETECDPSQNGVTPGLRAVRCPSHHTKTI